MHDLDWAEEVAQWRKEASETGHAARGLLDALDAYIKADWTAATDEEVARSWDGVLVARRALRAALSQQEPS